jgi:hypothetical protein
MQLHADMQREREREQERTFWPNTMIWTLKTNVIVYEQIEMLSLKHKDRKFICGEMDVY